ncbi:hypothetical protein PHAVU_005G001500 [Phaseolus vulgaris]|uniref:GST N-terminal domain-containing protein n=1 Tax=Phaseolus vulgaris TaxID=3885 RepID=V7BRH9_PHAVU|nr:hypothetical protein PHAVU_005G001500g [Phaseolus vulgaris]ESW20612.1 hypothetical protein PHAVU_005G001500g [Phaseolus vulgaris]
MSLGSVLPLFISTPSTTAKSLQWGNRNWASQRLRIVAKSKSDASPSSSTPTSLLSFLCPLLTLFSGKDPSQPRNLPFELATSSLASLSRFAWGNKSIAETSLCKEITSEHPFSLQLFEFEACPFCRRVREALTELDLSVEVYPCPKGSVRHREVVSITGGKEQFPFLIDKKKGISMYESGDIVKYLFEQYGEGRSPSSGLLESTIFTGWMPTILRAGRGMTRWVYSRPDPPPGKLELFSYENNPKARIVREALCELELPYILQNVGEGSHRMNLLLDASGSKEVPFFIDHSTGFQSGDCTTILSYLFETYSTVIL